MSGRGTVYSYTTVYDPPAGFEAYAPYPVALVKLDEGPMVTAQLTDVGADDVRIGMPVEMVTRKLSEQGDEGIIQYSYKFRRVRFRSRGSSSTATSSDRAGNSRQWPHSSSTLISEICNGQHP